MTEFSVRQRRRFPRVVSQKVLLVRKISGDDASEEFARSSTMGLNGCSFVSTEALGEGSVLEILISIGSDVVRTRARVVYERKAEDGHETGVEFLDLGKEDMERIRPLFEPAPPAE